MCVHHTNNLPRENKVVGYLDDVVVVELWSLVCVCVCVSGDEVGENEEMDEPTLKLQPFLAKAERSHLIVWQVMANQD